MGLSVRFVGNYINQTTRYYWVQGVFSVGRSPLVGPVSVTGPSALFSAAYDVISWDIIPGAISYDVLLTTNSTPPTGTSNIGLAIGLNTQSVQNTGQALQSYTKDTGIPSIASTDDLPEGVTNLYYTDARVKAISFGDTQAGSSKQTGTVYTLTATPAAIVGGTTSPTTTLSSPGNYLVIVAMKINHVGATYSASRLISVKLRRTNNTPADITNSTYTWDTGIITTVTQTAGVLSFSMIVRATDSADDIIAPFISIAVIADAGSTIVDETTITSRLIGE